MRIGVIALLLMTAACSKAVPDQTMPGSDGNQQAAAPNIAPTLVPGVALTYAYGFRLPIGQVAAVQERHAAQCEALGPTRCRIVGMDYHAGPSRYIQGTLSLKLAPEIARGFGKQSIATALASGGMLENEEITSVDAGAKVAEADRTDQSADAERRAVEAQLTKPGLGGTERTQLQQRVAALRDVRRASDSDRAAAMLLMASTPMQITYASGVIDPGFSDTPLQGALRDGWRNVHDGTLTLLTVLITLLPWAAAAVLIVWLWRRFVSRWLLPRAGDDQD